MALSELFTFEPLEWQEAFLHMDNKSPWAIGGNRSGKTEIGAYRMATWLKGMCPVTAQTFPVGKAKYWAIGLDYKHTHDTMRPKIEKYLGTLGVDYTYTKSDNKITMTNGNQLWFKSCDSGADKFQSADLDGIWFDEEPPFDVFKEAWIRCVDRNGMVYGTMTPLKGSAWLYQKVYSTSEDDVFQVISMAMTDNIHISKRAVEELSATLTEEEKDVRVRGKFLLVFGRAALRVDELQRIENEVVCAPYFRGWVRPVMDVA